MRTGQGIHRQREYEDIGWHERARCRGVDTGKRLNAVGSDITVWFVVPSDVRTTHPQDRPEVVRAIERYCNNGCPVRGLCWTVPIEDRHAEGVYGGVYWGPGSAERRAKIARGPAEP